MGAIPSPNRKKGACSVTCHSSPLDSRRPSSSVMPSRPLGLLFDIQGYKALAVAIGTLVPTHKPEYACTKPPVSSIPPNAAWFDAYKIASLDHWGHLTTQVFRAESASAPASGPASL